MTGKKILLVEDDKDAVRAIAIRLKSQGYDLVVAPDAIAAISAARREKPDLIILDLGLPGGDGFTVMKRLKSNCDFMLVPIIVVSARDPLINEARAMEEGAEAFFQKPVDNSELSAALERALSKPERVA
jgi:DNA-binding response OmpR family regulator